MKAETVLQNSILDYCKELKDLNEPIYFERRQAGGFSYKKGIPDVYVVYNGIHIEVEVKMPGNTLSTMQEKFKLRCKKLNIPYICAYSLNDFKTFLLKLKESIYFQLKI